MWNRNAARCVKKAQKERKWGLNEMKKVLCVLLSILLMLSLGTALAEGTEEEDWAGIAYSDIISEYVVALQEGWGPELLIENGMNYMIPDCENWGYAFVDLDGDGAEELILAVDVENSFFTKMVFCLYAVQGDDVVQLINSGERDRWYYAGGARFANVGSGSAFDSFATTYVYAAGELTDLGVETDEADYVQLEITPLRPDMTGLANPWVDTDAEGIMQTIGVEFGVPEGAEVLAYRMLPDAQLAEMQFVWNDMTYCARIQPTTEFTDISGLYFDWQSEESFDMRGCECREMRVQDGDETVDLCLWYDVVPGLMYSVFTSSGSDLDGFDLLAAVEQLYVPAQGDVG